MAKKQPVVVKVERVNEPSPERIAMFRDMLTNILIRDALHKSAQYRAE